MKKTILMAAAAAAMAVSSQAFAIGGVLGNVQGTVSAVLADPANTVKNLVTALPAVLQNGATALANTGAALPGILAGGAINSTSTTISVPLPGPGIINASLAKIPDQLGAAVASGGGSVDVTISTGP